MILVEWFRKRMQNFLQVQTEVNKQRYYTEEEKNMLIDKVDYVLEQYQQTNYVWYKGDSELLLYFYGHVMKEKPIINQYVLPNYYNYFWFKSAKETDMKRTHGGLAKLIVDTIVKCCGTPKIENESAFELKKLEDILKKNNFNKTLENQTALTLAIGDGAYFINIDTNLTNVPIIEYVDGRYVTFEYLSDMIIAVIKKTYIDYNSEQYVLYEKRSKGLIEYELFKIAGNSLIPVPLNMLDETKNLVNLKLNFDDILAVPCIHNYDKETRRGTSIFHGKLDLFDDFDQNITQESTIMASITPTESVDLRGLEVDDEGNKIRPKIYGKKIHYYSSSEGYGDGVKAPTTNFYDIDFSKISSESLETLMRAMSGILSPSTLGFDVQRNSTELSQREKEKVTFHTVGKVTKMQDEILTDLFKKVMIVNQLIIANKVPNVIEYSVRYPEYANPSFESKLQILSLAYNQGAMSAKMYVDSLYGDTITDEQKKEEIESLMLAKTTTMQDSFGWEV